MRAAFRWSRISMQMQSDAIESGRPLMAAAASPRLPGRIFASGKVHHRQPAPAASPGADS
jgi:hypothetical protein